jgi:hypothetical protein
VQLLGAKNTAISPLVLSADLYASANAQRFVFAIARGAKYASFGPAQVAFAPPGTTEANILDTNLYKDGLPKGRGIYVVDTVFPVAGNYKAAAVVGNKKVPFAIQVKDAGGRTNRRRASAACAVTDAVEHDGRQPDLHACARVSVARRLALRRDRHRQAGGGDVRDPQLCQSQYCGPVLDELLDLMAPYRDKMAMVHVEIYQANKGPNVAKQAPTVAAWGLAAVSRGSSRSTAAA